MESASFLRFSLSIYILKLITFGGPHKYAIKKFKVKIFLIDNFDMKDEVTSCKKYVVRIVTSVSQGKKSPSPHFLLLG